jgi:hypothetical protein
MNIIELAKQAGAMADHMTWAERDLLPVFERFAALVEAAARADEREACAKVCDDWPNGRDDVYSIGVAIRNRGQA